MEPSFYIEHTLNLTYADTQVYKTICNYLKKVIHETGRKDISCNLSYESFQNLVDHPQIPESLLANYNILTDTSSLFGVPLNIHFEFEDALVVLFDGVVSYNKLIFISE